jgi:hypothetical protein
MITETKPAGANPIGRDILVILAVSLIAAIMLVSLGGILLSQMF